MLSHTDISSSSFKLIHISVKISVDECFGSFSLVLTFIVFFCSIHFPVPILLDPYYTPSLYGSSPKCIVSGILCIPVTDKFPSFHLIVPPDVLETFTWVNCKKLKSAWLIWKVPSLCFRGFLSLMRLCYISSVFSSSASSSSHFFPFLMSNISVSPLCLLVPVTIPQQPKHTLYSI